MDNIFQKALALVGRKEVERIRAAAHKCSDDHSPENIASCQCKICTYKREGIDYFKVIAQNREDWIRKELEGNKDEQERGVDQEDQGLAV